MVRCFGMIPRHHFSKTMTRGRTRGGSIATTTTTTTTTHRWGGVRDVLGDDAHSLENLERLFGARANAWSFCKESYNHHKEKEKEKKRAKRLKELLVYLFRDFDVL